MGTWKPDDEDVGIIYAMYWRLVDVIIGQFGSYPTGHLLTVLTVILLDRVGYHPTVGELADLTGLPKSTVSRYISVEMHSGFIEEVIDSKDRRRRRLHPTSQGREAQKVLQQKVIEIGALSSRAIRGKGESADPAADLKKLLRGIREED